MKKRGAISSGELTQPVVFERRRVTRNTLNEESNTWAAYAATWAAVEPFTMGGREFFAASQVQSDISLQVRCRYTKALADTVKESDRIAHGKAKYDVRAIIHVDNARRELQFLCTHHTSL